MSTGPTTTIFGKPSKVKAPAPIQMFQASCLA
uniref:Uncharacterized protein n=1 Tax=Arundo donax TaxID=35708 RepID=A0A0A9H7Q2_ARUDO